jgi:hypothetical protein
MKKFDSAPRLKEIPLHYFYHYTVYLDDGTEVVEHLHWKELREKYGDDPDIDYHGYGSFEQIPLQEILEAFDNITDKDRFTSIKLSQKDCERYDGCPEIIGIRYETTEEIEIRKHEYDDALKLLEHKKAQKFQKAVENKRKQLEKLKMELGE